MGNFVDILFIHAHLFTMAGNGVGYVADGAVAVRGATIVAAAQRPTWRRSMPRTR